MENSLKINDVGVCQEPIESVVYNGILYTVVVRAELPPRGHQFVTKPADPLQVGILDFPAGHRIAPHGHFPTERIVRHCVEVVHIQLGLVKLSLYSCENELFHEAILATGDTVLLIEGGHGFEMLEATRLVEVKQGPYLSESGANYKISVTVPVPRRR